MHTQAIAEERYLLAGSPATEMVQMHLIADTAVGFSLWRRGRLHSMIAGRSELDVDWYLMKVRVDRKFVPSVGCSFDSVRAVFGAFLHRRTDPLVFGLKLRYVRQLQCGLEQLPNCGELVKVYILPKWALYVFPRRQPVRLPALHFRVL